MANDFIPSSRQFLIPAWYREFRIRAQTHIESGERPILAVAPKPDRRSLWEARQQVVSEMENEVDTFGLVEID